jgi:hypothetical protein
VEKLSATRYQLSAGISWNASHLPPGVYYAVLRAGNYRMAKQIVLMK